MTAGEHIAAAQSWLSQAEKNFDSESREANYERIMIANVHAEIAKAILESETS